MPHERADAHRSTHRNRHHLHSTNHPQSSSFLPPLSSSVVYEIKNYQRSTDEERVDASSFELLKVLGTGSERNTPRQRTNAPRHTTPPPQPASLCNAHGKGERASERACSNV
jgi:hypothetical protein